MTEASLQHQCPESGYRISLVMDKKDVWIRPWAQEAAWLLRANHRVEVIDDLAELGRGDLAFLLGMTTILTPDQLSRHRLNLVVHESDLPRGRGWSPVAWQIIEGRNRIPMAMIEAVAEMDAGPIWLRDELELTGSELLPEIRAAQGQKTVDMILGFVDRWPELKPEEQSGRPTYYDRRTVGHDRLEAEASLAEQFDRLRVVHNELYPAWFEHRGRKYKLQITPMD